MWILAIIGVGIFTGLMDLMIWEGFENVAAICSTLLLHQYSGTFVKTTIFVFLMNQIYPII